MGHAPKGLKNARRVDIEAKRKLVEDAGFSLGYGTTTIYHLEELYGKILSQGARIIALEKLVSELNGIIQMENGKMDIDPEIQKLMNAGKKWITKRYGYAPLMVSPTSNIKVRNDMYLRVVVDALGEVEGEYERVQYGDSVGWMRSEYLETYIMPLAVDCVDMGNLQTPNPHDAQQYITWKGKPKYNMCGEICIAYLLDKSLPEVLNGWERNAPSIFARIVGSDRGTSDTDLSALLETFGVETTPLSSIGQYTPEYLRDKKIIVSCHINKITGRLNGGGILHWIVPVAIDAIGAGDGTVDIYNPFGNRIERYSWAEFMASTRAPYGVMICK